MCKIEIIQEKNPKLDLQNLSSRHQFRLAGGIVFLTDAFVDNTLKTNKLTLLQICTSGARGKKEEPVNFWVQEVKGHDYMTPNLDLEVWYRHHS